MYDISTGKESPVVTDPAGQTNPVVEGNYIIWEDRRAGNLDIYMYDISNGKEIPVCIDPSPQKTPAISDGRIVWADGRIKGTNIFIYDIATGQEKTVSTASEYESNPAINGNRIVWQDKRKGTMDIFMFTEEASETGVAAGEEIGAEAGDGAKQSPLGIYPVSAAVIAAYLLVTAGKSRRRKI
jgi:beta propeller repeat protein